MSTQKYEWQTAKSLADLLGTTPQGIGQQARHYATGNSVSTPIERRRMPDGRTLYRVEPPAEREVRIEARAGAIQVVIVDADGTRHSVATLWPELSDLPREKLMAIAGGAADYVSEVLDQEEM